MNRRDFLKGCALSAIALPLPVLKSQNTIRTFKTALEVREWVRALPQEYGQLVDKGWVCRHIAGYRWLRAMQDGYLMGVFWQYGKLSEPRFSHMDNFTCIEDGSFYQIDVTGNVNPLTGWDNIKFDWLPEEI